MSMFNKKTAAPTRPAFKSVAPPQVLQPIDNLHALSADKILKADFEDETRIHPVKDLCFGTLQISETPAYTLLDGPFLSLELDEQYQRFRLTVQMGKEQQRELNRAFMNHFTAKLQELNFPGYKVGAMPFVSGKNEFVMTAKKQVKLDGVDHDIEEAYALIGDVSRVAQAVFSWNYYIKSSDKAMIMYFSPRIVEISLA
jgi:hypothetical protein